MKKLFFALMAVLAVTFAASCSKAAGELDDDPAKMTEQLKEQLDKKDGNKLVELVKAIPEKAAKFANSDKAKKYLDEYTQTYSLYHLPVQSQHYTICPNMDCDFAPCSLLHAVRNPS